MRPCPTAPAHPPWLGGCDVGCTCNRGSIGRLAWYALPCPPRRLVSCHLPSQGASSQAPYTPCVRGYGGLVAPVLTQVFVDEVLIEGLQDWVRPLLLGLLLTAVFHAGLLRLQLQVLRRLHRQLATGLSGQFLWHLLHLPSSFYAQRYAGEIS